MSTPETHDNSKPPSAVVTGSEFRQLFVILCRFLAFDALRLKPREKQLAILLGLESFALGDGFGAVDMVAWRLRLSVWRSNELKNVLADWRRSGWLAVDSTEQTFRLLPDRFPGWADVQTLIHSEERDGRLTLMTDDDLHKTLARISQESAIFSQRGVGGISETFPKTFNRSNVKRLNVQRSGNDCEIFATPEKLLGLMQSVGNFVGQSDWSDRKRWNSGKGWVRAMFAEEGTILADALNYCSVALQSGEIHLKKTRGAMLWDEFQRLRRGRASSPNAAGERLPAKNI